MLRRHEAHPLREQPVFVRGEKRRTREQAQIHRVEIVAKPGTRDLAGLDRAAGDVGALDHGDFPAFSGEMHGRSQSVDACADHDCIVGHSFTPALDGSSGLVIAFADRLPAQIFHI